MTNAMFASIPASIADFGDAIRAGTVSSEVVVRWFLQRVSDEDIDVRSMQGVQGEQALAAARAADAELGAGKDRGALHGVPLVIKDNIATVEAEVGAGSHASHLLTGNRLDAATVASLRSAGAVILGKVRLSEFGIGVPVGDAALVEPVNPARNDVWVGGSSSGCASAVGAGFAYGALGTDSGGSLRIPAAFSGLAGFKPTTGIVPASGTVALASSYDCVGPMARTVDDCRAIFAGIVDIRTLLDPLVGGVPAADLSGVRVGMDALGSTFGGNADPAVQVHLESVADALKLMGAEVVDAPIPLFELVSDAAEICLLAEAFEFHRDGLRNEWSNYGASTRCRLASGAFVSRDDHDRARDIQHQGEEALAALMRRLDVIVSPTCGREAPLIEHLRDGHTESLGLLYTRYWNATGSPVVSVPGGVGSGGLPIGVQVAGRLGEDLSVLRVGSAIQSATALGPSRAAGKAVSENALMLVPAMPPDPDHSEIDAARRLLIKQGIAVEGSEAFLMGLAYRGVLSTVARLRRG